jgi:hypothetical protein
MPKWAPEAFRPIGKVTASTDEGNSDGRSATLRMDAFVTTPESSIVSRGPFHDVMASFQRVIQMARMWHCLACWGQDCTGAVG